MDSPERLRHLPLPLFAVPMGVGGLGLAWREGARVLGAPAWVGEGLLALATAAWLLIAVLHMVRALRHPGSLAADLRHPVRSAFAGAITVGLMIVTGGLTPHLPGLAAGLWLAAVGMHLVIAAWTVRVLILAPREPAALTPPLLIPMVGNVLAPAFGARLGFEALSWMYFGLGALLWALLQPLLLGRAAMGPPLPALLRPSLVIFLAPPAAAALSLSALTGGFGPGPLACHGLAVGFAAVFLTMLGEFARAPFSMAWWGWTFPTAAFAAATLQAIAAHPLPGLGVLGWAVLLASSAIIATVCRATAQAAWSGALFRPD
ncbi:C4-dicarboxylate ABC transporter [Rhodovarius crocodyli]|uniref:C4-dicarboxylate ABC transporter n=1 Tax=Rhodovarius crocodyli TaxID=1979269 RepID=A0A437LYY9_9PROT|nr:C4-dicarboxylate ABC transporter [Rhodovarius crocodyli]RVT90638.1 C4-dicarboxylate ABC transporter [Rhodovarius crocodyli]